MGASWGRLGAFSGRFGGALGSLGASCVRPGGVLGRLGVSWVRPGASWKRLGGVLGRLGGVLVANMTPTWLPRRNPNLSKIEAKINQFLNASWDRIFKGFYWILGGF